MEILSNNKAVLKFLGIFFGTYIILTLGYQFYLEKAQSEVYYPEPITHMVSLQSASCVELLGYEPNLRPFAHGPSMRLGVNGKLLLRVVEGCNAVSVIILFLSFIIAFKKDLKSTLLYILAGSAILYALNILRIALLTIGIYEMPEQQEFMHGTLFPLFIYGFVFLLWMLWIINYKPKVKSKA